MASQVLIPITNLQEAPWRIPMYDLRTNQMDTQWVNWFSDIRQRIGGQSGSLIYDTATLAEALSTIEGQLMGQVANVETQLTGLVAQIIEQVQEQPFDPSSLLSDPYVPPVEVMEPYEFNVSGLLQQAQALAPVQSVFGRTGAVVAAVSDYNFNQIAGTLVLTTQVTGTLPVANGGTGRATLTANNVLLGDGTNQVQLVAPGTSGNVLTSNGTTWQSTAPSSFVAIITTKTATYTEANTTGYRIILVDATTGAITVNLPTAASAVGMIYTVKKIDASINAVTVDPNGAETIDGAATLPIVVQYTSMTISSNGTAWYIV